MRIMIHVVIAIILLSIQNLTAQDYQKTNIETLKEQKEQIILQEKEALKKEVKAINNRQENKEITASLRTLPVRHVRSGRAAKAQCK